MVSKWALAASFALAIAAAGDAMAQSATQWDAKAEPLEGRPGEYRTTSTDTWIRLTPYIGGNCWDGGLRLTDGPVFGAALEFEPADLLIASFDFNSNIPGPSWGGSYRLFSEARDGTDGDQEVQGLALHAAFYMGLKNPELKLGILQPIIGLGVGVWHLSGYDDDSLPIAGGGEAPVRFPSQWVGHASIFLRLDFDISDHVKFGFNLKNHVIFYTTKGEATSAGVTIGDAGPGNMLSGKTKLDNLHYAFEPDLYLSISF
ncbi:MAG TPA: hypothetical protein VHF22_15000 [Planctomycetota bacterium]|nr:hypothetical protein [Planctomycetota bacterium]